jgi:hypothetical protein
VVVGVQRRALVHLAPFIGKLEEVRVLDPTAVQEWGLSATTLEEVFLKLAGSTHINASVEGDAGESSLCVLCRQREATLVTLYTRKVNGRPVPADGLVCQQCVDEGAETSPLNAAPSVVPLTIYDKELATAGNGSLRSGDRTGDADAPAVHTGNGERIATPPTIVSVAPPEPGPSGKPCKKCGLPVQDRFCGGCGQDQFGDVQEPDILPPPPPIDSSTSASITNTGQVRGLLIRSGTLQMRQRRGNAARFICVTCCGGFNVFINLIVGLVSSQWMNSSRVRPSSRSTMTTTTVT